MYKLNEIYSYSLNAHGIWMTFYYYRNTNLLIDLRGDRVELTDYNQITVTENLVDSDLSSCDPIKVLVVKV